MTEKELSELTDEQLLQEAKKMKSAAIWSALTIGFMIGIIFYSVARNSIGFFTLIPLFFVYKMFQGSKNNDELKRLLKERDLD